MGEASSDAGGAVAPADGAGALVRPLRGRGLVDRRHARDDGGRGARPHGRRRVPGPLGGAPVGGHLRRRRPGGAVAGRRPAGRRGRARRRGRVPAPELGRGRHHVLGRRLPGRGGRARRALLRGQGGRLHPRRHVAGRDRDRRPFGHNDFLATYDALLADRPEPLWLVRPGDRPGGAARRGPRRSSRCSTHEPIAGPVAVDPDAPAVIGFTSGTTRDPKGVIHSHRTIGFETRQLEYVFPTGGPPQITGAPVGHFIGMLNAFLVPLLRVRPVNLIDVWDPGEVLRMMTRGGARRVAAAPPTSSPACSTTRTSPPSTWRSCPSPGWAGRPCRWPSPSGPPSWA